MKNNDINRHRLPTGGISVVPNFESHLVLTLRAEASRLAGDIENSTKSIAEFKIRLRNEEASLKRQLDQIEEVNMALDEMRKGV